MNLLGINPILNAFLIQVAKMTIHMPKTDQELVDVFVNFVKIHKVSYTTVRGKQVWQFLPGIEIAIKGNIETDKIGISNILINDRKLSVKNFNDLIAALMRALLSEKILAIWNKLSDKFKVLVFQKMAMR